MEQRFRALVRSLPLWRLLPQERLRRAEEGLRRSERGDFEGFREAAREVVHAMDEAVGGSWLTDYALDTIDRCQDRREVLEGLEWWGEGYGLVYRAQALDEGRRLAVEEAVFNGYLDRARALLREGGVDR